MCTWLQANYFYFYAATYFKFKSELISKTNKNYCTVTVNLLLTHSVLVVFPYRLVRRNKETKQPDQRKLPPTHFLLSRYHFHCFFVNPNHRSLHDCGQVVSTPPLLNTGVEKKMGILHNWGTVFVAVQAWRVRTYPTGQRVCFLKAQDVAQRSEQPCTVMHRLTTG